jgi:hypothetical protein
MGVPAIERPLRITGEPPTPLDGQAGRSLVVPMDAFAWEAVEEESARLGVPIEDLVAFAVLYYLADLDSGRVARRITGSPHRDRSPRQHEETPMSPGADADPLDSLYP